MIMRWNIFIGGKSWGSSLLLKSGILGLGILGVLWTGWPQPLKGDRDLAWSPVGFSKANILQEVPDVLHSVTVVSPEEPLKTFPKDRKAVKLQAVPSALLMDLNSSSRRELETLPGIGITLANRIVAYRDEHGFFLQINDLTNVSGIGKKRLQQLKPFVTVHSRARPS